MSSSSSLSPFNNTLFIFDCKSLAKQCHFLFSLLFPILFVTRLLSSTLLIWFSIISRNLLHIQISNASFFSSITVLLSSHLGFIQHHNQHKMQKQPSPRPHKYIFLVSECIFQHYCSRCITLMSSVIIILFLKTCFF